MNAYAAIVKYRLAVLFQYRVAALSVLGVQLFWGLIKVMVITAFYQQTASAQPISLAQAVTFIWLGQALLHLMPWNSDKEVEEQVKGGNVAYELVRPLDIYWLWFSRSLATRFVPTIMRSVPVLVCAGLWLGLCAPASWASGFAFGVSCILASLFSCAIVTLVVISLFLTVSGEGIQRLLPTIVLLLSGMVVPLPLFPEWLKPFLHAQPFRCLVDIPCRIYTGVIQPQDLFYYLGFQLFWLVLFVVAGRLLVAKAVKRLVIQGG